MKKRYNLFIGEKTLESLQKLAKHGDTSVSELIRQAIKQTYDPRNRAANRPPVPSPEPSQPQSG